MDGGTFNAAPKSRKAFFRFCVDSDYLLKLEEMQRIFAATANQPDEYGRRGTAIALQTKAFVVLLRCTGMSIGEVTKLEKTAVKDNRVWTCREKTGGDVFAKVPPFVIALNEAPHDSDKYFFWSVTGL